MKKTTILTLLIALISVFDLLAQNEIQRVRIDCVTPQNFTRHLLLSFTPDNAASDAFEYGYDGINIEDFPDDINWMIDDDRYVIQGVGAFDTSKKYPLGIFLTNSGTINISLESLENFNEDIDVFIFDAEENNYTQINQFSFSNDLESGTYLDRYYIAFSEESVADASAAAALSTPENEATVLDIKYSKTSHQLVIKSNNTLESIEIYSILGQALYNRKNIGTNEFRTSLAEELTGPMIIKIKTDKGIAVKKILL